MAVKIKYADPRKSDDLPEGITLVPINNPDTKYKDHYHVYALNEHYTTRTHIGAIFRSGEGHFICEVIHHKWNKVSGFRVCDKSFGLPACRDANVATKALYEHRLRLEKEGLLR